MSFEESFQSGLKAFSDKKFEEARDAFKQALEIDSSNPAAHTNLALTYFELGQKGHAVAHLKKALSQDPGLDQAEAGLKFVTEKLEVKEIPHKNSTLHQFQESVIATNSISIFLTICAALLLGSGLNIIRYLKAKRTREATSPLTYAIVFSFLFAGSLALIGWKVYDQNLIKATVVQPKTSAYSLPDDKSAELFTLYEGLEVLVQEESNSWLQVTYPGGPTGWIPKEHVIVTSRRNL